MYEDGDVENILMAAARVRLEISASEVLLPPAASDLSVMAEHVSREAKERAGDVHLSYAPFCDEYLLPMVVCCPLWYCGSMCDVAHFCYISEMISGKISLWGSLWKAQY